MTGDLVIECLSRDPQTLHGFTHVAAGLDQGLLYQLGFETLHALGQRHRKILFLQSLRGAQADDEPLCKICQFPDIAGPVMLAEPGSGGVIGRERRLALTL